MKSKLFFLQNILFILSFLSSLSFDSNAQTQLKDFNEIMTALKNGKQVHAVIYYAKCKLVVDSLEEKSPDAIGGMDLKTWEYFAPQAVGNPKGFLTSSENILISHRKRGYVYNYVKIKIYDDNKVDIIARYLLPSTLEVVMDEIFYGQISAGNDDYGVHLFSN